MFIWVPPEKRTSHRIVIHNPIWQYYCSVEHIWIDTSGWMIVILSVDIYLFASIWYNILFDTRDEGDNPSGLRSDHREGAIFSALLT